ncbi:hypothetical protein CPB83DRAFT_864961 [Crepidotus variabilis]|uniref:Uncharacterized protein n=1 Tax=Crepidotus variabilis TaxID=179855 RepID=A0A9P6JI71_9AGAR|nr:hypothetical protein CPB83DRAFT_864961 [Crepidotus variabilis]
MGFQRCTLKTLVYIFSLLHRISPVQCPRSRLVITPSKNHNKTCGCRLTSNHDDLNHEVCVGYALCAFMWVIFNNIAHLIFEPTTMASPVALRLIFPEENDRDKSVHLSTIDTDPKIWSLLDNYL